MSNATLTGAVREPGRKGPSRRFRVDGQIPGAVYGTSGTLNVTIPTKALLKLLDDRKAARSLITATFEGDTGERHVLIKDLQIHPVTDQMIHIDLWQVDPTHPIDVKIGVEFVGTPKGVKEQGGTLAIARSNFRVRCLPKDLVPFWEVNLTNMNAGETWTIASLGLPETVTPLDDPNLSIVSIVPPKKVAVTETAAPTKKKK
jgi:large subunit ribosomal protein L25